MVEVKIRAEVVMKDALAQIQDALGQDSQLSDYLFRVALEMYQDEYRETQRVLAEDERVKAFFRARHESEVERGRQSLWRRR